MKILVTGSAGFIGFHLSSLLLENKHIIIGLDSINDYYDISLKKSRLRILKKNTNFIFYKNNLCKISFLRKIFKLHKIDIIVHLAAQAGVRYSLINPQSYVKNNIEAFTNILEISREFKIKHLLFASSSSVYGNCKNFPLMEKEINTQPIQFYAATKKANEIMANSYSINFKIKITALRFFTVYGPFGRPDMALFKFTKNILDNKFIELYNNGNHIRDFTYIDDVVEAINAILIKNNNQQRKKLFEIVNIGNGSPIPLIKYLSLIEKYLKKKAKIKKLPLQLGDIVATHADISFLAKNYKFKPKISPTEGVLSFIKWYKQYYKIKD